MSVYPTPQLTSETQRALWTKLEELFEDFCGNDAAALAAREAEFRFVLRMMMDWLQSSRRGA
jgi:hypothetical protein